MYVSFPSPVCISLSVVCVCSVCVCVCVRARACVSVFVSVPVSDCCASVCTDKMDPTLAIDSLRRSAVYWLEWNRLVERNYPAATRVRLEDLNLREIVRALGRQKSVDMSKLSEEPRGKSHTSPDKIKDRLPDVTWKELHELDRGLASQVLEQAQRYGYEAGKTLDGLIKE